MSTSGAFTPAQKKQKNKMRSDPSKYHDGIFWAVGLILIALSVSLSAKSGFGVSMIVAPAYVLHFKVSETLPWFSFGAAEFTVQLLLIIAMIAITKELKLRYILTFGTAALYGVILDFWRRLVGTDIPEQMGLRIFYAACGIVICAFAIALMFRTTWPQEAYDMFVKDISEYLKIDIDRFKWGYDIASLLTAIALMLILFGRFSLEMVGFGTLITTLVNAPLIAAFGRLIDRKAKAE